MDSFYKDLYGRQGETYLTCDIEMIDLQITIRTLVKTLRSIISQLERQVMLFVMSLELEVA